MRRGGVSLAILTLVTAALSGCASPSPGLTSSFCSEYEGVWEDYSEVRASESATPEDVVAAKTSMLEQWNSFSSDDNLSDEIRDVIRLNTQNFSAAYGGERSAQASFWNGQDIVAMRCAEVGKNITFKEREIPLMYSN